MMLILTKDTYYNKHKALLPNTYPSGSNVPQARLMERDENTDYWDIVE